MTKLFSLELENYRIFAGRNTIEFGTAPGNQITIIKGGAGSGKSTILRAISWCLYGRENEQFSVLSPFIASLEALSFEEMYPGDSITTSVRLEVGEQDALDTVIKRKLVTKKTDRGFEVGNEIWSVESLKTGKRIVNPEKFIESRFPREIMESLLIDSDHPKSVAEAREFIGMISARGKAASLPIFISERPSKETAKLLSSFSKQDQQLILLYDDAYSTPLEKETHYLWSLKNQQGASKIVRC